MKCILKTPSEEMKQEAHLPSSIHCSRWVPSRLAWASKQRSSGAGISPGEAPASHTCMKLAEAGIEALATARARFLRGAVICNSTCYYAKLLSGWI